MIATANSPASVVNVCTAIVARDLCAGCGICAAVCPAGNLLMEWSAHGQLEPRDAGRCVPGCRRCLDVCPLADTNPNEDELAARLYGKTSGIVHSPAAGFFLRAYAGHVSSGGWRQRGSSGGVASWFLASLLERGFVDAVVCAGSGDGLSDVASCRICGSEGEVRDCAGSKYCPVEFSAAIRHILEAPGRYAMIGLPCMIKAVRLASLKDRRLRDRIVFAAGLVCGQTRSRRYVEALAREAGFDPAQVKAVEFRAKNTSGTARDYAFTARDAGGRMRSVPWIGGCAPVWISGAYTPRACCFCDDVFAETADVAFMDAWLPEYQPDGRGNSIVLLRSAEALAIVSEGMNRGGLDLREVSLADVVNSQAGVLVQKRHMLGHRLWLASRDGAPPKKRVTPVRPALLAAKVCQAREQLRSISQRRSGGCPAVAALPNARRWERALSLAGRLSRGGSAMLRTLRTMAGVR